MFSVFDNSRISSNKNQINLNREQILNSKIKDLYVYVTPLNIVNDVLQGIFYKYKILKSAIAQNMNHTAIIIRTGDESLILIEYGAYDENSDNNDSKIFHYYKGDNGLRFIQITDLFFTSLISDERNSCVHCDIKRNILIKDLLHQTEITNGFNRWDKNSYNFITHNCQLFVSIVLKILGATCDFTNLEYKIPVLIQTMLIRNEILNSNNSY